MPSPFPGMNPYIEHAAWEDFHGRFIAAAANRLAAAVAPAYVTRIERHVYIHERSAEDRRLLGRPDISIYENVPVAEGGAAVASAPAVVVMPTAVDIDRVPYLEIRDRDSRRVVTVIELLSLSNKKPGADRDQYWGNVRRLLSATDVSLVELDLLRGGRRMPWDHMPACDHYALVSRPDRRPRADFWPVFLRDRLPEIPIPLAPGGPEASLDIQAVLHEVYDDARYALSIYDDDPDPPLSEADLAWARSVAGLPQ